MRLRDLKGLGPKTEKDLISVGINNVEELKALGPIAAYLKLKAANKNLSLNFLYALVGAVNGEHWLDVARRDKPFLLSELEGYAELEKILAEEGVSL